LSAAENRALYGKCNHESGHGHTYVVHVTVEGPVDPVSGMVINLFDLDRILEDEVVGRFGFRSMDEALKPFGGPVSTAENIARAIWTLLEGKLPPGVALKSVHIGETLKNTAEFHGEGIGITA
ncbi:MAG: 6-carboxytetrahydropterin synthase, partial [Candidatus Methylomirabilis sp.]|nr:6-carboxytetrahydropterin synthase [Deltaproteobacteria bacterium]